MVGTTSKEELVVTLPSNEDVVCELDEDDSTIAAASPLSGPFFGKALAKELGLELTL